MSRGSARRLEPEPGGPALPGADLLSDSTPDGGLVTCAQMHEQSQVVAETLRHHEDARVQGSAARQAVRTLGESPKPSA